MKTRKIFLLSLFMLFLLGIESGGLQLSLSDMANGYGLSGMEQGSLVAAQYSAIIMMPLIAGAVAQYIGKRRVLKIFCFIFAAGCGLVINAGGYVLLLLGIFIVGAGYSVCESLVSAILTESYETKSGKYLNLVQGAFSVGAVLGPHMMEGAGRKGMDWRFLFLFCGTGFLVAWIWLHLMKGEKTDKKQVENIRVKKEVRFPPVFSLLVLSFFLYGGMEVGVGYYIDTYMQSELGGRELSAWAVSLFWLAMVPARLLSAVMYRYRKILLPACFLLAAPIFGLFACITSQNTGVILFAVLGLFLGTLWPNLMGTATEDYKDQAAMAAGIMSSGCGLGAVVFPLLFGRFLEGGGLRTGFVLLAVCSALGGWLCLWYGRSEKARRQLF